jgi:hypothetical protein
MAFRLREQLHWCDCGGTAVFLDVRADRYFCLAGAANRAFLRLALERIEPGDQGALAPLVERGLLVPATSGAIARPARLAEQPCVDLAPPRAGPPRLRGLPAALAAELAAAWLLRHRSLSELVASSATAGTQAGPSDPLRCARDIAAAAARVALLTGATDRCLVRALAVHRRCRRRGLRAALVFGVRMHPFAAHCWVQLGSAVLVGGLEQVRLHTPIMVLE